MTNQRASMAKDRGQDRNKLGRRDAKPDEAREPTTLEMRMSAIEQSFSGPLPPPGTLREYGPDWGERIVQMAESEVEHRHTQERTQLDIFRKYATMLANVATRGQFLAAFIAVLVLGVTVYAIHEKESGIGIAAMTSLAAIITAFILKGRPTPPKLPGVGEDNGDKPDDAAKR